MNRHPKQDRKWIDSLKPPTRSKYIYSINVDVSLVDDLMHMQKGKPPIKYKTGKPSWINPHKARKWICPTISIYRRYPKSGIGFLLAAVSLIIGSTQQKSCMSLLAHGRDSFETTAKSRSKRSINQFMSDELLRPKIGTTGQRTIWPHNQQQPRLQNRRCKQNSQTVAAAIVFSKMQSNEASSPLVWPAWRVSSLKWVSESS